MFSAFADSLVSRAYPDLSGRPERELVLQAMKDEMHMNFLRFYEQSLTDEQRIIFHVLSSRDDPRLGEFLTSTGFDERLAEFKRDYEAELLADVSSSLMPDGGSKALSTVRLRKDTDVAPGPVPPLPTPPPAKAEPSGQITINVGRRPKKET